MTADRIYRSALPMGRAWDELRRNRAKSFDPDVVTAFEQVVDEEGRLRPLPGEVEAGLDSDLHVPIDTPISAEEWRARLGVHVEGERTTPWIKTG
jgi:hypothetical protein